ncbi:50S ribosomal protein L3 [Paraliomyxa miuraensis]|uniref:50S ribosomal protein L3 n=1 Tax=Paraliomyxa miuraensis TaxID=376150 RepID=UPI0022583A36|nr:50S ribosomal protein L3 [Paraliomyxa miuraensis]MCX4239827.1 50S ribosomal protein L3 [Paraliomyxa miuraensis]
MNLQPGLIAKKLGMTQLFLPDGTRVPVTVLSVKGNTVTAHRTTERDGYTALQVGFEEQKASRMTKADLGRFGKAEISPRKHVREFRVSADVLANHPVGQDISLDLFAEGAAVDVTGTSKGKGFQGVMKRHNMRGKPATHGVHEYFRHGGSIGCRLTPGRVQKGKRMGGQMGNVRKTEQNLTIAKVLPEEGVLLVRGSIPGSNSSIVTLRLSHKAALRAQHAAARGKK